MNAVGLHQTVPKEEQPVGLEAETLPVRQPRKHITSLSVEGEALQMRALALAEKLGRWHIVRHMLEEDSYVRCVALQGSEENRVTISLLRERLSVAMAYEAVHGTGSLIDRSNPLNEKYDRIARRIKR